MYQFKCCEGIKKFVEQICCKEQKSGRHISHNTVEQSASIILPINQLIFRVRQLLFENQLKEEAQHFVNMNNILELHLALPCCQKCQTFSEYRRF